MPEQAVRYVPLEAEPLAVLVWRNGVLYLVVHLVAGCECHPDETVFAERVHCMS